MDRQRTKHLNKRTMSHIPHTSPRKPLFKDEDIDADYPDGAMKLSRWDIHTLYEGEVRVHADLIQQLVDAWYTEDGGRDMWRAIAAAERAGFKPVAQIE